MTSRHSVRVAAVAVAAALVAVGAGCDGGDTTTTHAPCDPAALDGGEPVALTYRQQRPGGPSEWIDRLGQWDADERGVDLSVELADGYAVAARESFDATTPALRLVPSNTVGALASGGAIQEIGDCLADAGVDLDALADAARTSGVVDGERYGVPVNQGGRVLLYDRAAFARAGLDPERPPETEAEFLAAATALRDRGGYDHPVDWPVGSLALSGMAYDTPEARDAAQFYVLLGSEGLLLRRPGAYDDDFQPIADGRAAIQLAGMQAVWSLGDALARGQAPDVDLGVMGIPSARRSFVALGGDVLVLDASAAAEQAAAAARFIAWVVAPESQALLHVMSDHLPLSDAATRTARVRDYWARLPLHAAAWELARARGMAASGDELVIGAARSANFQLARAAFGDAEFDDVWNEIVEQTLAARAMTRANPEGLFDCMFPQLGTGPPETLERCV